MIITIKRSGGFAGFDNDPVATVDTSELDMQEQRRITAHIEALAAAQQAVGADMLRYDIELQAQAGGASQHLTVADEGDPDSTLHKLLDSLGVAV